MHENDETDAKDESNDKFDVHVEWAGREDHIVIYFAASKGSKLEK